jgi:2-methylcitrate dehydratase PrpD
MEGVTQALANFAADLKFEALDPRLLHNFKKYLLDGIGCGLYGTRLPWCQIVNQWIKEQRGRNESTLWLQGFKGPSSNVSLGLGGDDSQLRF